MKPALFTAYNHLNTVSTNDTEYVTRGDRDELAPDSSKYGDDIRIAGHVCGNPKMAGGSTQNGLAV